MIPALTTWQGSVYIHLASRRLQGATTVIFNRKGTVMKKLAALVLLIGTVLGTGCARPNEVGWTPAYSWHERQQLILRNWDYEGKQKDDDLDSILLLRPASHLTIWNVR
jgi:hypothetical protein